MRRPCASLLALLLVLSPLAVARAAAPDDDAPDAPHVGGQRFAQTLRLGPLAPASETTIARAAAADVLADESVRPASMLSGLSGTGGSPGCDQWQLLPEGLIYRPYLAGVKESRISGVWNYDNGNGRIWDITLGGQAPLLRYGPVGTPRPEGFQISLEASGQVRLDRDENMDVEATDYRFGVPVTWGDAVHQTKFAFYHLSSHLGDEFLLRNTGFPRVNYSQNVLVYGHSLQIVEDWRVYAEAGYGFDVDVAKEWQFQFGVEWAPEMGTGFRGAPFAAFNGYLREEVDFGGNGVAQVGWAWRRDERSGLLRLGLQYYNGKNEQFSLFDDSEQKVGFGIWYDF